MEEHHLWYLAGLLDGEGSFSFQYRQGQYAHLSVHMGSRDEDVILYVQELVGGTVRESQLHGRPFHHWRIGGRDALQLMSDLYPLMSVRRQGQIADAIWRWWQVPLGNAFKTHCKNNHEFTPQNTIRNPCDEGRRRCRTCTVEARRRADAKRAGRSRANA